nr:hypothetical protein CFP56_48773 [Quercus suber]
MEKSAPFSTQSRDVLCSTLTALHARDRGTTCLCIHGANQPCINMVSSPSGVHSCLEGLRIQRRNIMETIAAGQEPDQGSSQDSNQNSPGIGGLREQIFELANAIAVYQTIPNAMLNVPLRGSTNISGSRGPEPRDRTPLQLEILITAEWYRYTAVLYEKKPYLSYLTRSEASPTVAAAMLNLLQILAHRLHEAASNVLTVPEGAEAPPSQTNLLFD